MKNDHYIELYTDYLISVSGQATAKGLSAMMDNEISHDLSYPFFVERRI